MRFRSVLFAFSLPLVAVWWWLSTPVSMAPVPERELRGVWMATVLNIDYPSRATTDAATLQAEMRSKLRRLRRLGFNAVFLQVRPAADAFYPSEIAPWSSWLSGRQGVPPASGFDPLAFAIDEAHYLGMELHAWLNPYRAAMTLDTLALAGNHVFYEHRDWVVAYGTRRYLDPGVPAVQDHLVSVVGELVNNYELDGIHFDDYFYPYPEAGTDFPDSLSYYRHGRAFGNKADWRRDNVNRLVERIHARIQADAPEIQFGISPFGVWRNSSQDPRGSETRAQATSYDNLFGDAMAWARDGTVDYLAPQLYWSIGYEPADYAHLLEWWTAHTPAGTRLLVGHAAYKVGNNHDSRWDDLEELPRQVDLSRRTGQTAGGIYFSTRSILENELGLDQRLSDLYAQSSLLPVRAGATGPAPQAPKLEKVRRNERGPMLIWSVDKDLPDDELPYYYAVYRRENEETDWQLIATTPFGQGCRRYHYYDEAALEGREYAYEVRALDRYHRISPSPSLIP